MLRGDTSVTTYTHDLYGRRTSAASPSGNTTYGWNPLGQLTSVTTPQSTSVYSYGANGMREKAVVTTGNTTKITESVWDGMRLVAELDSDDTLWRYVYAPDGTPLAVTKGFYPDSVTYSYHTDAPVNLYDPTGAVIDVLRNLSAVARYASGLVWWAVGIAVAGAIHLWRRRHTWRAGTAAADGSGFRQGEDRETANIREFARVPGLEVEFWEASPDGC